MRRNPIDEFMKDPDNKARLFVWITKAMIVCNLYDNNWFYFVYYTLTWRILIKFINYFTSLFNFFI